MVRTHRLDSTPPTIRTCSGEWPTPQGGIASVPRAEEDAVTLDRFLSVTGGFTRATVRVAMVRAIADLRLGTAKFTPLRCAEYHRFYRAVLNRLP